MVTSTMKLSLPNVTLIALSGLGYDTQGNIEALKKSAELVDFGAVKYIQLDEIKDIDSWNKAVIYDLHNYVQTDFALFVHSDGYVINADAWRSEFLEYDYIGAPWPLPTDSVSYRTPKGELVRVGNSVSLRSKKILQLPSRLGLEWKSYYGNFNEDGFLTCHNRDILKSHGCRFADINVAKYFSKEHELPENQGIETFAFHTVDK